MAKYHAILVYEKVLMYVFTGISSQTQMILTPTIHFFCIYKLPSEKKWFEFYPSLFRNKKFMLDEMNYRGK